MKPPRVMLDLFCGVGGAAMGYYQQWPGTHIIGIDIEPQPNYPFDFVCADVFDYLRSRLSLGNKGFVWVDFIHASPLCKRWAARQMDLNWPDQITPLRQILYHCRNEKETLIPFTIENVSQAPIRRDLQLCGTSLGLTNGKYELRRHRYFEIFPEPIYMESPKCNHNYNKETVSIWGRSEKWIGYSDVGKELMEMPWANWKEFRESIPPAYTKWLAEHLEREP